MNVESSDGRSLRRRKSSCFLRGEASLGRPFHTCRCYRSVLTRKKDSCRHTCNIWAVLGLFGGSLAAIDRHPAHSLCSGLCCYRIGLVFGSRLSAASTALTVLGHTVAALTQFLAGALLDVDAADCGEAQSLPLGI